MTDSEIAPVQLDESGSSHVRLRCLGVAADIRQRLSDGGVAVVDDADEPIDALVVSTRLTPAELKAVEDRLATHDQFTIILAHTGGERLAVQLIEAGADAIVGEGNEEALLGLTDETRAPNTLLSSYQRRFGAAGGGEGGTDPDTGLLDRATFEQRIAALGDADEIPRVAFLKVLSDRWQVPDADPVVAVQRRRLATMLANLAQTASSELYATSNGEFGLVGPTLTTQDITRFAQASGQIVGMFKDRGLPVRAVIGHAGRESSDDVEELLDLARRAVEVAAADGGVQLLGAEDLSLGVSTTTELEVVVRMLDQIEPLLPEGVGHGQRVARMSAELARIKGWSPAAVARAQLAGHLHDVGRTGLPLEAIRGPDGLTGEALAAWRTFPARSASLLRLTAGTAVADSVHAQRERWDGEGFPDGLRSTDIPEPARLLAVAHALDEIASQAVGSATVATKLAERSGSELDPELAEISLANLTTLLHARLG